MQKLISDSGLIDLSVLTGTQEINSSDLRGYVPLSFILYFDANSDLLDNKAKQDIRRAVEFLKASPDRQQIIVAGFSDSVGQPSNKKRISEDRARKVAQILKSENIPFVTPFGFGDNLPISDNSTPDGKAKNRRVEIWIRKN